jgi:hypothetical protein
VPVTATKGPAEGSLADAILVSGGYRQQSLPEGALLRERPITDTEVLLASAAEQASRLDAYLNQERR